MINNVDAQRVPPARRRGVDSVACRVVQPDGDDVASLVLDVLVGFYIDLRGAWRAALMEHDCAADAPWSRWRDLPDDAPIAGRDVLMQYAEQTAMLAAQAITHHLGLLARGYWLEPSDPHGPDRGRWLHGAPFAPARAVIEGTSMIGWLIDPSLEPDERVVRGAMLGLWSHRATWEGHITDAGLTLGQDDRDVPVVLTGANPKPLSQRTMIRAVHGNRWYDTYQRWSKLCHHDPRATARLFDLQVEAEGATAQGIVREDEHVALVAEVAALLREAGQRQADYFGRTVSPDPEI